MDCKFIVNIIEFCFLNKIYFNIFGRYTFFIFIIITLNPYNLLVFNYINKEIILQLLSLLYFVYLFKNKFLPILVISLIVFFIRDAYGVILISFYFFLFVFKRNLKIGLFLTFILLYIVQLVIFQISDFFFNTKKSRSY